MSGSRVQRPHLDGPFSKILDVFGRAPTREIPKRRTIWRHGCRLAWLDRVHKRRLAFDDPTSTSPGRIHDDSARIEKALQRSPWADIRLEWPWHFRRGANRNEET